MCCALDRCSPIYEVISRLACWDSWRWDEGTFNHDNIYGVITTSFSPTFFCRTPKECMWNVYYRYSLQYSGPRGGARTVVGRRWMRDEVIKAIVVRASTILPRAARGGCQSQSDTNTTPPPVHHCLDVHCVQLLRKGPRLFVLPATTQNWSHHGQSPWKQEDCM